MCRPPSPLPQRKPNKTKVAYAPEPTEFMETFVGRRRLESNLPRPKCKLTVSLGNAEATSYVDKLIAGAKKSKSHTEDVHRKGPSMRLHKILSSLVEGHKSERHNENAAAHGFPVCLRNYHELVQLRTLFIFDSDSRVLQARLSPQNTPWVATLPYPGPFSFTGDLFLVDC